MIIHEPMSLFHTRFYIQIKQRTISFLLQQLNSNTVSNTHNFLYPKCFFFTFSTFQKSSSSSKTIISFYSREKNVKPTKHSLFFNQHYYYKKNLTFFPSIQFKINSHFRNTLFYVRNISLFQTKFYATHNRTCNSSPNKNWLQ